MKKFNRILTAIMAAAVILIPVSAMAEEQNYSKRMETVIKHVEDALRYARCNVPGARYPNMLVNGYSVDTKKPTEWKHKGESYYPSNLTSQQNFLRVLVGLTNLTGDTRYRKIAEEQVSFWFDNEDFMDKNGLLYAGEHSFIDVKSGAQLSYNEHELKQVFPYWEFMYEVEPEGVKRYIEACWNAHVINWSNLCMNRHGYYNKPMSTLWNSEYTDTSVDFNNGKNHAFQNAGDDLINMAFFLAEKTGEEGPELWGRRMLQKYIDTVNPVTGLSGAQYGEMDGGDRFKLQYPELGDTARERNFINKQKIRTIAGYDPLYLIDYAERTGDEEVMNFIIRSAEGTAKYVYDWEKGNFKTPMWSDGTDHRGYVIQRAGYHGVAGKVMGTAGESVYPVIVQGTVKTALTTKNELIWDMVRDMAKVFELGDIGTKPGENVSLNMDCSRSDFELALALLDLYENTKVRDYLTLAEKLGDNMIKEYNKLAEGKSKLSYMQISREDMVALLRIEASVRGVPDAVDNGIIAGSGTEFDFDGWGRSSENRVFYALKRTPVTQVEIDDSEIVIAVNKERAAKFNDISGNSAEQDIRSLYALGAVNGVSKEAFCPDDNITRAQFISIVTKLCNFSERAKKFSTYDDVPEDAWYRDSVEIARNNALIDEDFLKNGLFAPNDYITMEEMTSVIVKALISINKDVSYVGSNASLLMEKSDLVSQWARSYIDIACNYQLINYKDFTPDKYATRSEAAAMAMRLNDIIGKDFTNATATVYPSDATRKDVNWTSGDKSIFEVDKNGRIYPAGKGVATLTAEVEGITDTSNVHIIEAEDWMLRKIKIDGVPMENFVPNKSEYVVNLLLGTEKFPEIAAESYYGNEVKIEIPDTFPGAVTISVGDTEKKYTLNFIAEKIEYTINEDFESRLIDRGIHNLWSGDTMISFNAEAMEGEDSEVLVKQRPDTEEENKCLVLPYFKDIVIQVIGKFDETPYIVGADSEDDLMVLDFDLMVSAPLEGVDIRIGTNDGTKNLWPIKLLYSDTTINAATGNGVQELATYTPGEYTNIKIVLNKKALVADWYINNQLVLEEQDTISVGTYDKITRVAFMLMSAESEYGAKAYLDNVKMYRIPKKFEELITR